MYLHDGWVDSNEIWNGMCPEGLSIAKMVQFCSGIIKLQMRENDIFLVSV